MMPPDLRFLGSLKKCTGRRWGELLLRALVAWALAGTLACGSGFFAREAPVAPRAPALAAEDAAPIFAARPEDLGRGCSPKGCPRPPSSLPFAVGVASSEVQRGTPVRSRARLPSVRRVVQGKSPAEIARMVRNDLDSLGSMTFGTASRGALLNAVHMPEDDRWIIVDPPHAWGTAETIRYLVTAIDVVTEQFPDSPRLFIGDLSRREGGYLSPHLSHQSGRDVDIGYFYKRNSAWYRRATPRNLDLARTWALIRTLIARTDVHYIFIDRRIQRLLRAYAEKLGEDDDWLESIFHGSNKEPPIILHEPGHDTHFHVRFYNPVAEDTARRCYQALLQQHKLRQARYHITHRVRRGETLIGLAQRYRTTVTAIMKANRLRRTLLREGKSYLIPRAGPVGPSEPAPLPPRRVPPVRPVPESIAILQG